MVFLDRLYRRDTRAQYFANADADAEEKVNVADVSYLLNYLFGIPTGPEPGPCP